MSGVWEALRAAILDGDADRAAARLRGAGAGARAALLVALDQFRVPRPEPEPVVLPPLEPEPEPELPRDGSFLIAWFGGEEEPPSDPAALSGYLARRRLRDRERQREWERERLQMRADAAAARSYERRRAAYSLAVLACQPTATDAAGRLRTVVAPAWPAVDDGRTLRAEPAIVASLLALRGGAWCAAVGRAMTRRLSRRWKADWWPFAEALLKAGRADPPAHPGAVTQWVGHAPREPGPLRACLAADPWLDRMLPRLFDTEQGAAALAEWSAQEWPAALAALTGSGRVDRDTLLRGCLRRLRAGGRPGRLRPFLLLADELAPAADEWARYQQELIGLLTAPLLRTADLAYAGLRAVDRCGRLAPGALAEITASVLARPEKKLFRAHLAWLREVLAADPRRWDELGESAMVGLHHPSVDLAEHAVARLAPHFAALRPAQRRELAEGARSMDPRVGERLAALLGVATPTPTPAPSAPLSPGPPPEFPPPLSTAALAAELASLRHLGDDPVRFELLLASLAHARRHDPDGCARALAPLVPRWPGPWSDAVAAAAGVPPPEPAPSILPASTELLPHPLDALPALRLTELAARLTAAPPPALLATPATRAGHVDPERVLHLLIEAEQRGWIPGHADLTQALLRLPRTVDAAVHAAAARLLSPPGRRFAAWLERGVIDPDTWVQERPGSQATPPRRIAVVDPTGLPAALVDARRPGQRSPWERPNRRWAMTAPSQREVVAAAVQPLLAPAADADRNVDAAVLSGLAAADGPPGPAMRLTLAYALAARRPEARLTAADALATLARRADWDSTGVGGELGTLTTSGRLTLSRVIEPLRAALDAGAHQAVWQIAAAALPPLVDAPPRPGLADLLGLAEAAARAGGHRGRITGLAALAARPGRGRMSVEARRLASTLDE